MVDDQAANYSELVNFINLGPFGIVKADANIELLNAIDA